MLFGHQEGHRVIIFAIISCLPVPGHLAIEWNPGQVIYRHVPLSIVTSQCSVMACNWEGNHRSDITLATRHRH